MEAVILAGGLGTRLREKVYEAPKVLAETAGKPFVFHVLDYLYRNGITHVVLAVSYMHEMITEAVGSSYLGMTVDYSVEETPLGTGGAIKKAMKLCRDDFVFVINGDTFFDVDLRQMRKCAEEDRIVIALRHTAETDKRGTVKIENGTIVSFKEKKATDNTLINGGIYLFDRKISLCDKEAFSFEHDFLEKNCNKLSAFVSQTYFIDIGTPDDYEKADRELEKNITARSGKAAFLDRDGTINIDTGHLYKKEEFVFKNGARESLRMLKEKGYYLVVVSNQAGIAKGMYTNEDVLVLNDYINDSLRAEGLLIDLFVHCPHHPEGTVPEYTKKCSCRKPEIGMITEALEYFSRHSIAINLKESVMIGDSENDMLAGKNAGIGRCIRVDKNAATIIDEGML